MKNTKWIVGVILGIVILVIFLKLKSPSPMQIPQREKQQQYVNPNLTKTPTKKLMLKNTTIDLLVAETPHETMWGLSDFPSLPPDTGMMFQFDTLGIYPFWMKDMRFALDMIWLDSDNRVITIHENISPDTYYKNPPELFQSTTPTSAVIEVSGGFVEKNNLSVGDRLLIN